MSGVSIEKILRLVRKVQCKYITHASQSRMPNPLGVPINNPYRLDDCAGGDCYLVKIAVPIGLVNVGEIADVT